MGYGQKQLFDRNEQKELFDQENTENLRIHRQNIQFKFLEEIGNLPARCSVQINTTELRHPVSFRFSMPSDMEKFLFAFLEGYKRIMERKVPDYGFRGLRYDLVVEKVREMLKP